MNDTHRSAPSVAGCFTSPCPNTHVYSFTVSHTTYKHTASRRLFEACRLGLTTCAELILAAERETAVPDDLGRTPLHIAALNGHAECVSLLLKKLAPVDAKDSMEQTALHCAAANGSVDAVEALIAHQADGEARDGGGATPLIAAAKANQLATATALMNNGANINAHNRMHKCVAVHPVGRGI